MSDPSDQAPPRPPLPPLPTDPAVPPASGDAPRATDPGAGEPAAPPAPEGPSYGEPAAYAPQPYGQPPYGQQPYGEHSGAAAYGAPQQGYEHRPPQQGPGPGYSAYGVPPQPGYGPPYPGAPTPKPAGPSTLGLVALILAIAAIVIAPIVAAVPTWDIGQVMGVELVRVGDSVEVTELTDLSILAPVRSQVLLLEIVVWVTAIVGLAALVLGIVAVAKRWGRGPGIGAIVVSVLLPVVLFGVIFTVASVSLAASAGMAV